MEIEGRGILSLLLVDAGHASIGGRHPLVLRSSPHLNAQSPLQGVEGRDIPTLR